MAKTSFRVFPVREIWHLAAAKEGSREELRFEGSRIGV
jgi:hypothetical protein